MTFIVINLPRVQENVARGLKINKFTEFSAKEQTKLRSSLLVELKRGNYEVLPKVSYVIKKHCLSCFKVNILRLHNMVLYKFNYDTKIKVNKNKIKILSHSCNLYHNSVIQ